MTGEDKLNFLPNQFWQPGNTERHQKVVIPVKMLKLLLHLHPRGHLAGLHLHPRAGGLLVTTRTA